MHHTGSSGDAAGVLSNAGTRVFWAASHTRSEPNVCHRRTNQARNRTGKPDVEPDSG